MWTASGQNEFQNLLSSLRRTKSCKKDLWSKITAAVQNASLPGLATQQQWYLASGCTAIVNLVQLPWSTHQPLITSVLLVVHLLILRLYQLFLAIICLVANYTFNTQWRIASYHHQAATVGEIPIQVSCFVCRVSVLPCWFWIVC